MRRLVILRPEPGAAATIERAIAMGLDALAMPLFAIEAVPWDVPDARRFDALLLTSANALAYGGPGLDRLRALPTYAVGEATALAAQKAGLEVAGYGVAGIDQLLETVPPELRLLHLCGEHRAGPNVAQTISPVAVYRSGELPPPKNLREVEGQVVAVHSPRAGHRLAELVDQAGIDRGTIRIAAISQAAALAAGGGWDRCAAVDAPDDTALLALAARLCDKPETT